MAEADEEQKNAFALEVLTLLIETPPADGEDAALTQEQVDEAKKALTQNQILSRTRRLQRRATQRLRRMETRLWEPEPAPEPEPVPEPTSDAILAHLIEAGTVTDEAIMKVLTPTMPEPTADELLNHLLENDAVEAVSAEKIAKALVAKALEEEAAAEAERKAAEEEAAAAAAAAAEAAAPPDGADEQPAASSARSPS